MASARTATTGSGRSAIVWHKVNGDLRVHDNEPLALAHADFEHVAHVFCFDPRWFGTTSFGFSKTGPHRARFMVESVADLAQALERCGNRLLISRRRPEDVLPEIARVVGAAVVLTHSEVCDEELRVEAAVRRGLAATSPSTQLRSVWGNTLYHLEDLPFPVARVHNVFSDFRRAVEKGARVRAEVALPARWRAAPPQLLADGAPVVAGERLDAIPTVADLGVPVGDTAPGATPGRGVLDFKGGEQAALRRLREYFWERDCLRNYKVTRNGMLGADYSSKFAPWLAFGCLSPRRILAEIRRYEAERVANESTYWLVFELIWRDFFRFSGMKWGTKMFKLWGPKDEPPQERWTRDPSKIAAWCEGRTGYPFVDANMRELRESGFMSNRGRQNVASFFTKDLGIDWRVGAEWFESMLLDYDPCSNYGNWTYVAGVGADPREGRYFNIVKQAKQYDPDAAYTKHWVPEVARIPSHFVLDPQQLRPAGKIDLWPADYSLPIVPLRLADGGHAGSARGRHGGAPTKRGDSRGRGHAPPAPLDAGSGRSQGGDPAAGSRAPRGRGSRRGRVQHYS